GGVYGTFRLDECGCRWGWMRLIDVADPAHPSITGEYMIAQDQLAFCGTAADTAVSEQFRSFSSHNPTVLPNLALIDWHSGGLQAIDLADPANPTQAGFFLPNRTIRTRSRNLRPTEGPTTGWSVTTRASTLD